MLKSLENKNTQKIKVIGGGFSGLTLAYYLNQKGFKVEIFEKEKKLGGLLQSESHSLGLIESSANGILGTSLVKELFSELKIETVKSKKESQRRYIYRNRKLKRFPLYFSEMPRFFLGVFLFFFLRPFLSQPKKHETILSWGEKIFGKKASFWLLSPMLQGIYGSPSKNLSARLILKNFFKKKRKKKRNYIPRLIAPKEGMHDFIQTLELFLKKKGVSFHYSKKVENPMELLSPTILATPLSFTKKFLLKEFEKTLKKIEIPEKHIKTEKSLLKEYKKNTQEEEIEKIKTATESLKTLSLLSITLFYATPPPFKGFGILFPETDIKALGVLNNGDIFNHRIHHENLHSETWIYGGEKSKELLNFNEEQILEQIEKERAKVFQNRSEPLHYKISKWFDALPLYNANLKEFLDSFLKLNKKKIGLKPSVFFTGNYLGSIGLSGILEYNKNLSDQIETFLKK